MLEDNTEPAHFRLHLRHEMVQRKGGLDIRYELRISNADPLRQSRNNP